MPLCHLGQRHAIAMAFFNDPYSPHRMTTVRNLPGVRRQGFFGTKGWLNHEKVRHIWLPALCGALAVMQASRFERLSFDPFP